MDMIWIAAIALVPVALLVARAARDHDKSRQAVPVRASTSSRQRR